MEYEAPFCIEYLPDTETGWGVIESNIFTFSAVLKYASRISKRYGGDQRVRIVDANGKII